MKTILRWAASTACFVGLGAYAQITTTFDYTGDVQTYTVPTGVTTIEIEAWGGQGQEATIEDYDESVGGLGGYATGVMDVTPGDVLTIYVGGAGLDGEAGYNGGGAGGFGTPSTGAGGNAGSGGGASDVRFSGVDLEDRVIVAGGGGGGGRDYINGSCVPCGTGGDGGAGGGIVGLDGDDPADAIYGIYYNVGAGGSGGTDLAGGEGGDGTEGVDGLPGVLGIGGDGIDGSQSVASGGGGGGYYGGGAGAGVASGSGAGGGGGAGGSSYLGVLSEASTLTGVREGNGQIIIRELCVALITDISELEICEGEELTLYAESTLDATVSWDADIVNGEAFIPSGTGVITYVASSDDDGDCPFSIDIMIHEAPEVTASSDELTICDGDELTLTGGGADSYEWNNDAEDGVTYVPMIGAGVIDFQVIGTSDEFGCIDSATVAVTIYEKPTVVAVADQESYCEGEMVTLTGTGADDYTWDMGVVDGEAFEQEIGTETYSVIGTSADGCENTDVIEVTVISNPQFTITTADELYGGDGTAILVIDLGIAPFLFDWDNDETGDFDDDQSQLSLDGGTYTVIMTDATGCSGTATITIGSQLSIGETTLEQISVYPNPTADYITIAQAGEFQYKLTAMNGKVIQTGVNVDQAKLDLSELPAGVYVLELTPENGKLRAVQIVKE